MPIRTATRSAQGRGHDHNEDAVRAAHVAGWHVLAVADGMGGHPAGHVASDTAVEAFVGAVTDGLRARTDGATASEGEGASAVLRRAAEQAHEAVADAAEGDREGMGCTLVGGLVREQEALVVNVGDSRAYHVTDDEMRQLTVDQTVAQQLVEAGEITQAEAKLHKQRGVLAQALGRSAGVDSDVFHGPLTGTLLLCSDGLTDDLQEREIHKRVREADDVEAAAEALVAEAETYGGKDDVTVALARQQE